MSGSVVAGPVCPVEREPPDPACAARPVAGATLIIEDAAGSELRRVTSDAAGHFSLDLVPGSYRIVPQRVPTLLGTAPPLDLVVREGEHPQPVISYDTGIR